MFRSNILIDVTGGNDEEEICETLILAKGGHRDTSIFFGKTLWLLAFMADPKVDAKSQSF